MQGEKNPPSIQNAERVRRLLNMNLGKAGGAIGIKISFTRRIRGKMCC